MPSRPVSLTVHRNTLMRRRARAMRQEMQRATRATGDNMGEAIAGYAVIAWNYHGHAEAYWNGAEALGPVQLPDHVSTILNRAMARRDVINILFGGDDSA